MKAEVENLQVLESGCMVSHNGAITIYPLPEDRTFAVTIQVRFFDSTDTGRSKPNSVVVLDESPDNTSIIQFNHNSLPNADFSTSGPIVFAVSDDEMTDYLANIAVKVIGEPKSSPTYTFFFTILEKRSSNGG